VLLLNSNTADAAHVWFWGLNYFDFMLWVEYAHTWIKVSLEEKLCVFGVQLKWKREKLKLNIPPHTTQADTKSIIWKDVSTHAYIANAVMWLLSMFSQSCSVKLASYVCGWEGYSTPYKHMKLSASYIWKHHGLSLIQHIDVWVYVLTTSIDWSFFWWPDSQMSIIITVHYWIEATHTIAFVRKINNW